MNIPKLALLLALLISMFANISFSQVRCYRSGIGSADPVIDARLKEAQKVAKATVGESTESIQDARVFIGVAEEQILLTTNYRIAVPSALREKFAEQFGQLLPNGRARYSLKILGGVESLDRAFEDLFFEPDCNGRVEKIIITSEAVERLKDEFSNEFNSPSLGKNVVVRTTDGQEWKTEVIQTKSGPLRIIRRKKIRNDSLLRKLKEAFVVDAFGHDGLNDGLCLSGDTVLLGKGWEAVANQVVENVNSGDQQSEILLSSLREAGWITSAKLSRHVATAEAISKTTRFSVSTEKDGAFKVSGVEGETDLSSIDSKQLIFDIKKLSGEEIARFAQEVGERDLVIFDSGKDGVQRRINELGSFNEMEIACDENSLAEVAPLGPRLIEEFKEEAVASSAKKMSVKLFHHDSGEGLKALAEEIAKSKKDNSGKHLWILICGKNREVLKEVEDVAIAEGYESVLTPMGTQLDLRISRLVYRAYQLEKVDISSGTPSQVVRRLYDYVGDVLVRLEQTESNERMEVLKKELGDPVLQYFPNGIRDIDVKSLQNINQENKKQYNVDIVETVHGRWFQLAA